MMSSSLYVKLHVFIPLPEVEGRDADEAGSGSETVLPVLTFSTVSLLTNTEHRLYTFVDYKQ